VSTEAPPQPPTPPVAARVPSVRELHGDVATDDYAWMRDPDDEAFHSYLADERAYYDACSRHLDGLATTLAAEAASRIPAGDEYSVSWPRGGFTYRMRMPEHSDNWQLLRSREGESSEEVLLDENVLAKQTGFVEVGVREPSPDGALLAWSADTSGDEYYDLRIRDLRTGQDLAEVIAHSYTGVAWSVSSDYVFYLVRDELHRPFQVWRHKIGTPADADELVYEETDQQFDLTLEGSRSGRLAIITSEARETSEVHVIDLDRPLEDPVVIAPRRHGIEYRIDHARETDDLYVVTNAGAEEFTLMRAALGAPSRDHWELVNCEAIAPARDDTRLHRCDVLADHLVLTVRRGGEQLLVITDHDGGNVREVRASVTAGWIRVEHAEEYDRGSVIIGEESLIEPLAWYELDLETGARTLLKRLEVRAYDPARYRTERRTAPAPDGTPIPVTIAHRADVPLDGSAPCLLYGYGAYEATIDPEFERSLPSLLDRGVVYAIAHIRGGGEGGRRWWLQGRMEAKPTTFTDFLAAADWLAGGLVDGTRIVSRGISAGGLLQGAVYSMRPDRWRAVVAEVPFVDCLTTMLDASIPLTATEWEEWGDPRKPDEYAWIRSYSPYDNLPLGRRPPLLATGAVHDARVMIHEPAKWVAKLRATNSEGSRILFRAELGVGSHGGPSGRSAQFRYEADIQAFILEAMGIA
jgi:oligopeptidase B